jgi:peptidylprolyl isomerase
MSDAPATPADDGFEMTLSGLKYKDEVVGDGEQPEGGNVVKVDYTGWLAASDFKFDSSVDRGIPFTFTIGKEQVIPGWDEGVATMKVGGKRTLIVPPRLGYGDQNIGGGLIPPDSTLKFDVELLEVKAGALAGLQASLETNAGGLLGNFGANPFTFFALLLVLVTVAPAFLPDDNPLMQGGNPFQAPP